MLNAMGGVLRTLLRPRLGTGRPAGARRLHRGAVRAARSLADLLSPTSPADKPSPAPTLRSRAFSRRALSRRFERRQLLRRLTSERALPIAIAVLVALASGVSLAPAASPAGAVGAISADIGAPVRLAIGGLNAGGGLDSLLFDEAPTADPSGYLGDATLYKPVAVDTSVKSSEEMLREYTVKNGDTLTGIASRFGVSMMTVWWANKLKSKDDLKVGQVLVIPPVNGLVVTVDVGDTLETLAKEYKVDSTDIVAVNQLDDTNLIVGQVLVMPGAKGEPIPTPKPTPKPQTSKGGGGGAGVAPKYSGGPWAWPVVGGGNYISQYFHYGHYGLDVAADYGSTVVATRPGTVVFAGWKSNGGGYQVWINHGSGIYTSYNHLSAVTVSSGQSVSKGQRVGRVGMSGWATGPHLHLEVWIGRPWESGAYRVNPLRYY
ncbi:MAG: M23 family metallopeptidase [Chloroflexi bacterium]|nr:M23 family metallopeptidase [Chloroflexota bacterium]